LPHPLSASSLLAMWLVIAITTSYCLMEMAGQLPPATLIS
jgi:hypothetical protein